jgi:biopolymer transport protein ExbB/TolQ
MDIVDELVKVALLGATWVLYIMFGLSILAVAAMIERWWFFRKNTAEGDVLGAALDKSIEAGDEAIAKTLERNGSVEARVLATAFAYRDGGSPAFLDAVDGALADARKGLDRGTTLLGTIGNNAPFVGLFGTVLGVIEAFSYLGAGDAAAMGNVMAGISEALVATAVGIFVAIPSVVGYNVAQKKAGDLENATHSLAKRLSAWLRVREAGGAVHRRPTVTLASSGGA